MFITDLPRDNHYRYIEAAFRAALLSPGAGRDSFRLGAVIKYKKQILKSKSNTFKTHTKYLRFNKFPSLHAEAHAIISLGLDNCENTDLYVIRIQKNNHIGIAMPCSCCQELIKYVGIKKVYYTSYEGVIRWQ